MSSRCLWPFPSSPEGQQSQTLPDETKTLSLPCLVTVVGIFNMAPLPSSSCQVSFRSSFLPSPPSTLAPLAQSPRSSPIRVGLPASGHRLLSFTASLSPGPGSFLAAAGPLHILVPLSGMSFLFLSYSFSIGELSHVCLARRSGAVPQDFLPFFLFFLATPCGLQDLSSLTRD